MFDAVISNKAKLKTILGDNVRNPREDLVTSSLFGSLRFLSSSDRAHAVAALTGWEVSEKVAVILWPSFNLKDGWVEPDVILSIGVSPNISYWIVEVKWGAGFQEGQAAREIEGVLSGRSRTGMLPHGQRVVVGYTLVGEEPKHHPAMKDLGDEYGNLISIESFSWPTVTERLQRIERQPSASEELIAWAGLGVRFLKSQPEGNVLDNWPLLEVTSDCSFEFDVDEKFRMPNGLSSVPKTHFDFNGGII